MKFCVAVLALGFGTCLWGLRDYGKTDRYAARLWYGVWFFYEKGSGETLNMVHHSSNR